MVTENTHKTTLLVVNAVLYHFDPSLLLIVHVSSKIQLTPILYRTIYLCIMIHMCQYIDTPKLCIVTFILQAQYLQIALKVDIVSSSPMWSSG